VTASGGKPCLVQEQTWETSVAQEKVARLILPVTAKPDR